MSMFKGFLVFSSLTLFSRVLGLARDAVISAFLGATYLADAFLVAFRLPNLFRMFFAEGAMSAAFVPVYSDKLRNKSDTAAQDFLNDIFSGLFLFLTGFSILAHAFMPQLVGLIAPGFVADAQKLNATVFFSHIMFPYIICIALVALLGASMQAKKKFAAMAFMPAISNIMFIAAPYIFKDRYNPAAALSYSFMVSGLTQVLFMLFAARKYGIKITLKIPTNNLDNRMFLRKLFPTILGHCVTRVNILIGTFFASMGAGSVSYLYYADRLQQLPTALIGVAMGYVLLPVFSQQVAAAKPEQVNKALNTALKAAILLCAPAVVAFSIAPQEIVVTLFGRGKFTPSDVIQTAATLKIFAFGMPAIIVVNIIVPLFFANGDTKTPAKISCYCLAINLIGGLTFGLIMRHKGVAISVTLVAWSNFIMLTYCAKKKGYCQIDRDLQQVITKTIVCSAAMGLTLAVLAALSRGVFNNPTPTIFRLCALCSMGVIALLVYVASLGLTKTVDVMQLYQEIRRGRPSAPSSTEQEAVSDRS